MRISGWKGLVAWSGAIAGMAIFLTASAAPPRPAALSQAATPTVGQKIGLGVDAGQSRVHFSVDSTLHTVHGTFTVKGGDLQVDPATGKASGQIVVLMTSGESGNGMRDERMHKEILETPKFGEAVFRVTLVEGKLATAGSSEVKLRGTLGFHGGEHEVALPVHVEFAGESWKGTGKFEVPYIQWGLKDPSNFLLKVKPVVAVEVELAGKITSRP